MSSSFLPAIFYPFHLCHEKTLTRLLQSYDQIHFKNFLAIQLTPLAGTTAFEDRMGDYHPELLDSQHIVQGYDVSGPLSPEIAHWVNADLQDPRWRTLFHRSLKQDLRFREGLFGKTQGTSLNPEFGSRPNSGETMLKESMLTKNFTVKMVQELSKQPITSKNQDEFDYGFSLVKTSASLAYTYQLANTYNLQPVTDSFSHFLLFHRTIQRHEYSLVNTYISRQNY